MLAILALPLSARKRGTIAIWIYLAEARNCLSAFRGLSWIHDDSQNRLSREARGALVQQPPGGVVNFSGKDAQIKSLKQER